MDVCQVNCKECVQYQILHSSERVKVFQVSWSPMTMHKVNITNYFKDSLVIEDARWSQRLIQALISRAPSE